MKLNIVPARAGWYWVKSGIGTFWRQPLAMSGLFLLFMGVVSLLSVVPLLGSIMALVLLPAATLGLMAATRQAAEGRFPMPTVLATAFTAGKAQQMAMLKLGAMYAVGFLGVIASTAVFDGGAFAQMYLDGTALTEELAQSEGFQTALWVGMGLNLPLAMLFWHAPALVHWHNVEPSKSLFFSAMACWKNKAAMLVFGACWVGVFMLGGLVVNIVGGVLGAQAVVSLLTLPAVMAMASMFFTSIYFTFRDSFTDESSATTPPEL